MLSLSFSCSIDIIFNAAFMWYWNHVRYELSIWKLHMNKSSIRSNNKALPVNRNSKFTSGKCDLPTSTRIGRTSILRLRDTITPAHTASISGRPIRQNRWKHQSRYELTMSFYFCLMHDCTTQDFVAFVSYTSLLKCHFICFINWESSCEKCVCVHSVFLCTFGGAVGGENHNISH